MFDALLIQLEKARVTIKSGEAYTFDIGPKELINMIGLPMADGNNALRMLLQNNRVKAMENRIYTSDTEEILKQASYYRKMQRIEKSRKEQRRF